MENEPTHLNRPFSELALGGQGVIVTIEEFRRLLVALDGSDNAARAAKVAVALAKKFGAGIMPTFIVVEGAVEQ